MGRGIFGRLSRAMKLDEAHPSHQPPWRRMGVVYEIEWSKRPSLALHEFNASGGGDMGKTLLGLICTLMVQGVVAFSGCSSPSSKEKEESPVEEPNPWLSQPSNDAELLIARCGSPSQDESTEFDDPRPPIPSRLITYRSAALRFAYVPGGGAKVGDPPPYQWKLVGIVDLKTGKAVNDLSRVLKKRLPCAVAKE